MEDDQWRFQESHLIWVHLINMPIRRCFECFPNSSVKSFFTKIKDFSKSTIIDINLIFFLAWSLSVSVEWFFYQLKCNFDIQGKQSVLVFMAVHVAVCFLFNSTLPLHLIV